MTHKDIYTKFMIEYDKANVTSSYPSLTEYEVATVLDKAYNALIAQKVTGNNPRRSTFESDTKSIADLNPLITTTAITNPREGNPASNVILGPLPSDLLYFVQGYLTKAMNTAAEGYTSYQGKANPADGESSRLLPARLVNHEIAQKFFSTAYNMPWVKEPVCYIEDNIIYFVYDALNPPSTSTQGAIKVTYIKQPNTFVKDLSKPNIYNDGFATYFDFNQGTLLGGGTLPASPTVKASDYTFECNSTVAEELISLAVAFALENVESQRLNSKLNMRGLEA